MVSVRLAFVALLQLPAAWGATLFGNAFGASGGVGAGHGAHGGVDHAVAAAAGAASAGSATAYLSMRSRQHQENIQNILSNMTLASALTTLQARGREVSPTIVAMAQGRTGNLRATPADDEKGYASLQKAKTMLNQMIEEVMEKYDAELDRCCDFERAQSVLIEESRQDISFFGGEAAEAREAILDAQQQIEECETKIPKTKVELAQHEEKCAEDIKALRDELDIVLSDIAVMSMVLKMTECDTPAISATPKKFMLLACEDECGKYTTFNDADLLNHTSNLKSQTAQQLLQEGLSESVDEDASAELVSDGEQEPSLTNMTTPMPTDEPEPPTFNPRTKPCKTPAVMDKRSAKCTVGGPNCQKLQERFLLIQAGIMDKRDELKEELNKVESECKEIKDNYEALITDLEARLKDQQTRLAASTKKLSVSNEQMRLKEKEFKELKDQYSSETVTCHTNYQNFEGEECGLKKIRGELFKMQGGETSAFFQDCTVSEWEADECSKSCAKGTEVLSRSIITPTKGGTKCPPLAKTKTCNLQKCPIDCSLADWQGWSECSADCGGGMKERLREVLVKPRYLGESCTQTTEAESCNMQACDADCVLSDWTAWSDCSKACGGGTSFRRKTVVKQASGSGKCYGMHDEEREQSTHCNQQPCLPKLSTLRCESEIDVVMLLDGSGSVGSYGWGQTKEVGKDLARAFHAHYADIQVAVILFSGPRRWRDVQRCGGSTPPFGWTKMYTKGAYGPFKGDKASFNAIFHKAHMGIVRRQCMWCRGTHRDIYFRRKTEPAKFDAWENLMVTWRSEGFHEDYDIYSTLQDALQDTKRWEFCNGGDRGIGFPRDCNRWSTPVGWQWQSLTRGGQRHFKWEALTKIEVDMEKDCKIKFVHHFTNNTADLIKTIDAMEWPRGATLTAQALQAAQEELPLSGRADAQSVVVAITDGRPVSVRKTEMASLALRKKARLFWVAVTRYAPKRDLRRWASLPNDENLVIVDDFGQLDSKKTINSIVSDVCPEVS